MFNVKKSSDSGSDMENPKPSDSERPTQIHSRTLAYIQKLEKTITTLRSENTALSQTINESTRTMQQATLTVDAFEKQIAELTKSYENNKKESEEQIGKLTHTNSELKQKLSAGDQESERLANAYQELFDNNKELRRSNKELRESLVKSLLADEKMAELESQLKTLKEENTTLTKQNKKLEAQIAKQGASAAQKDASASTKVTKREAELEAALAEKVALMQNLQNSQNRLSSENATLKGALQSAKKEIVDLNTAVEHKAQELKAEKQKKSELSAVKADLERMKADSKKKDSEMAELSKELQKTKNEADKGRKTLEDIISNMDEKYSALDGQYESLKRLNMNRQALENAIDEIENKQADLSTKLAAKNAEIDALKKQHASDLAAKDLAIADLEKQITDLKISHTSRQEPSASASLWNVTPSPTQTSGPTLSRFWSISPSSPTQNIDGYFQPQPEEPSKPQPPVLPSGGMKVSDRRTSSEDGLSSSWPKMKAMYKVSVAEFVPSSSVSPKSPAPVFK